MRCLTAAPSLIPVTTPSMAPTETCQNVLFQCGTEYGGYYVADVGTLINGFPLYRAMEGSALLIMNGAQWTISMPMYDFHVRQDFTNSAMPISGEWELVNMQTQE